MSSDLNQEISNQIIERMNESTLCTSTGLYTVNLDFLTIDQINNLDKRKIFSSLREQKGITMCAFDEERKFIVING